MTKGVVTGYGDDTFRPNRAITRSEVARMLHRSVGSPAGPASHPFDDVPAWVDDAVAWLTDPAARPPVATGYPDGTFRPTRPISRGEVTRMLYGLSLS